MESVLATLHLVLAVAFGATIVALGVAALAGYLRTPNRLLVDRVILGALAASALSALVGLALFALRGPPSDPLHLLYGAVAIVVLPLVRYGARNAAPRRLSLLLAISALALLGVVFRLWTTA